MSVDALCESACMSLSDSCQLKTSKFSRMCAAAPAAGRESVSSRQQPEGRWVRSGARFMERGCVLLARSLLARFGRMQPSCQQQSRDLRDPLLRVPSEHHLRRALAHALRDVQHQRLLQQLRPHRRQERRPVLSVHNHRHALCEGEGVRRVRAGRGARRGRAENIR